MVSPNRNSSRTKRPPPARAAVSEDAPPDGIAKDVKGAHQALCGYMGNMLQAKDRAACNVPLELHIDPTHIAAELPSRHHTAPSHQGDIEESRRLSELAAAILGCCCRG